MAKLLHSGNTVFGICLVYDTICMEQPYNRTLLILKESFQGFSASGERLIINGFTS
ncbi:MAG: hypothetical protein AB9903_23855 [Vulcanimicrobiota bacterium]